jgi:hypothetical protein
MTYQLNITIDDAGLRYIYDSGQVVALVKSVIADPAPASGSAVVWVAFAPFEQNRVTWEDGDYYLYASKSQNGISETIQTANAVQSGFLYVLLDDQFTATPASGAAFAAENEVAGGNFTFGLVQQGLVNNLPMGAAVNAVPLPFQNRVSFTPSPSVAIFLAQSTVQSGSIINGIPASALTVQLTGQPATVVFDDSTSRFTLQQARAQAV